VLTTGQCIGHYEIVEKLGEGGMGVVYKARDIRLNRFVALKLLLAGQAGHENQLRRFALEARAASTLNHPNIVTVHDVASENGSDFIVMEYVRGSALDQLIPRKGMRLNEVLKISIQIADALSAAAAAGIVHRDLKPGNIMVTDSGLVKVVDFGLAKLIDPSASDQTATMHPNSDELARTREGTVVGTVSYMSPEQAEGKTLDTRSDIFSFGALLYEMVTGQRAFRGETTISTLSAILRDEPQPVSALASDVPREFERIVNRCLRKDPDRRFQTMADVRVALLELKEESDSGKLSIGETPRKSRRAWWVAGASAIAAIAIGAAAWLYVPSHAPQPDFRVMPLTSYAGFQRDPAFSPDGNQIAFAWTGRSGTVTHIYAKIIGTDTPLQLTFGDMSDMHPAWAPDGKSIAFIRVLSPTVTGIYEVPPLGGPERHIAEVFSEPYQTLGWSRDNKWLVTSGRQEPGKPSRIFAISVESGQVRPISLGSENDEFYPALSFDSERLAFSRETSFGRWGIFVVHVNQTLEPTEVPRRLQTPFGLNRQPVWTPDGKEVIFANGGTVNTHLWRVAVDGGTPARDLSMIGTVAYQPAIASRGDRLAYVHDYNNANIWSIPITPNGKAGLPTSAVSAPRSSWIRPNAFSPDGKRITFESDRSGPYGVWIANTDGSNATFLSSSSGSASWGPDGRTIAFDSRRDEKGEIYLISADGGPAHRITGAKGDNLHPCWSRDGKWIYFDSNRTGRFETFKISPQGGDEIQVTHNGGWTPQESPDGKFIFYTQTPALKGPLFKMPLAGGPETEVLPAVSDRRWAVSERGVWFLESTTTGFDPGLWLMETPSAGGGNLRFLSFATGAVTTPRVIPKTPAGGLAISRDGSTLLYNQVDHQATEILLVEHFR
jgi:eukaryotic-like serine/threonine-protein kinase